MKKPELKQPLGHLAAEELLRDLRLQPELRKYVLPELWLEDSQISAIQALSQVESICVVVGLAEDRLPHGGDEKQGGRLNIGLVVYVFQCADGVSRFDTRQLERVWLTAFSYAGRFEFTPPGESKKIPAILRDVSTIDLRNEVKEFQAPLTAHALGIEIPVRV